MGEHSPENFCSLTSLRLHYVDTDSQSIEYFLSNCPSLESLCLNLRNLGNLKVSTCSLKHLEIFSSRGLQYLEISAMSLVSFMYYGSSGIEMSLKSVPSLVDLFIGGSCCVDLNRIFPQLSSCLSQLTKLTIDTMDCFCLYDCNVNFPEKFPQLSNLKELEVLASEHKHQSHLPWIGLIEACPKLSRLIIKQGVEGSKRTPQVPQGGGDVWICC
ncbi:putative ubiquitin-protein ligase [Corchorus olitorius]|uniref:Ubiquitin-protein ligase n=1 Tax=Corchorus olitorius TaxID=93759 RepID=A0A1R3H5Y2_9ROSI|nr:putative ubiquitin-protein ligase [Corchorus olitorius]